MTEVSNPKLIVLLDKQKQAELRLKNLAAEIEKEQKAEKQNKAKLLKCPKCGDMTAKLHEYYNEKVCAGCAGVACYCGNEYSKILKWYPDCPTVYAQMLHSKELNKYCSIQCKALARHKEDAIFLAHGVYRRVN